jgi:hypothetical protein
MPDSVRSIALDGGKNDEACQQFRQVLEFDENFWLAFLMQGIWHALEGSVEPGVALAERATLLRRAAR